MPDDTFNIAIVAPASNVGLRNPMFPLYVHAAAVPGAALQCKTNRMQQCFIELM